MAGFERPIKSNPEFVPRLKEALIYDFENFLKTLKSVHAGTDLETELPDRELASAPINSPTGQKYLGAMRAGINCALANRQILTHLLRRLLLSDRRGRGVCVCQGDRAEVFVDGFFSVKAPQ